MAAAAVAKGAVVTSFAYNALTTQFARPDDCTGVYQPLFLGMMDVAPTCLPDGFQTASDVYFSPGISCPAGYVRACHDKTGAASLTTVTCCPTLNKDVALSCVTTSTLSSVWATLFCTWIAPPGPRGTTLPVTLSSNGVTSTVQQQFRSPGGLNAFGIRMVYQRSDLDDVHAPSATKAGASSPTSSTPAKDAATPPPGLSTGAQVAVGVSVPVVVLALLAAALVLWRRRRRRPPRPGPARQGAAADEAEKTRPQAQQELHADHVQEMMGYTARPVELAAPPS